ncbi:MAG: GTPase [Deltaproteobacteria bacterium]|nr:GTPase [Deltaproteobacteria bacterium]
MRSTRSWSTLIGAMKRPFRCLVLGAAGRDFHDAQRFFRDEPRFELVAFTAAQIPSIDARSFPGAFIGYPSDIPVHPERELESLVRELDIDVVLLSYSDLAHEDVMHLASRAQSAGASFMLLGPRHTELRSTRPVVAVTAVRTGVGKSSLTQHLAEHLRDRGVRAAVLRHPMPYGDLRQQRVQRLATWADLDAAGCTVEEREEYVPYIERSLVIWAGVDYEAVLRAAESEAEVVLWDGGNNDSPFLRPDLLITLVDPLRPGHETRYYPGETNLRRADILVATKVRAARPEDLAAVKARSLSLNPRARWVEADLHIEVDDPERIRGRRVLVVEDGPTTTHGGMTFGAATLAARKYGAGSIVDPREHAVGSIAATLAAYPALQGVLPALGYTESQRADLAATIAASGADLVLDGSPAHIERAVDVRIPVVRVRYRFEQLAGPPLLELVDQAITVASEASR